MLDYTTIVQLLLNKQLLNLCKSDSLLLPCFNDSNAPHMLMSQGQGIIISFVGLQALVVN